MLIRRVEPARLDAWGIKKKHGVGRMEWKVVTRQPAPSAHYSFAGLGKGVEFQDSWAKSNVQLSEASRALAG